MTLSTSERPAQYIVSAAERGWQAETCGVAYALPTPSDSDGLARDPNGSEGARSIVILSAAKDLSILRCGGELHTSFAAKDAAQDDTRFW